MLGKKKSLFAHQFKTTRGRKSLKSVTWLLFDLVGPGCGNYNMHYAIKYNYMYHPLIAVPVATTTNESC